LIISNTFAFVNTVLNSKTVTDTRILYPPIQCTLQWAFSVQVLKKSHVQKLRAIIYFRMLEFA